MLYKGEVIDRLIDVKTGEVREVYQGSNLVVDSASVLIAALMKNEDTQGVQYFAVGRGSGSWSDEKPPSPEATLTSLVDEFFRKRILPENITFIDNENKTSEVPTNRIQITVMFEELEANGPLREIGIFGGDATDELNSGIMINCKIHPLIHKTPSIKLERTIRFTF